jgi:hypothetical protein
MPEPVRYRNKGTQSDTGAFRYRNWDKGWRNADDGDIDHDAFLLVFFFQLEPANAICKLTEEGDGVEPNKTTAKNLGLFKYISFTMLSK